MMKKKKHLHTNFIKFIVEKYNKEIQELPEEETNLSNKNLSDEFDRIINSDEVQDEVQDELENDDENIDDLIKEYRLLEKIYKSKTYGDISNRRK
jgi:capsular polysaccharide biosynthesis protein